jgi:hypothetical protein
MQIDTKVFVPFTLHYSASAAATAASPVTKFCSSSSASDHRAAADSDAAASSAADTAVNDDESAGDRADGDSGEGDAGQPLTIVTAASSDYFNNSLNLIGRQVRAPLKPTTYSTEFRLQHPLL